MKKATRLSLVSAIVVATALLTLAPLAHGEPLKLGSVAVLHQTPKPVAPGGTATYDLTLTRGTDRNAGGNLKITVSVTGLPSGATFLGPTSVNIRPKQGAKTVLFKISTTSTLATGTYSFTVTATTQQGQAVTTTGTLVVGTGPPAGPTAVDDSADTPMNMAVNVNVRTNDLPAPPAVLTVIA